MSELMIDGDDAEVLRRRLRSAAAALEADGFHPEHIGAGMCGVGAALVCVAAGREQAKAVLDSAADAMLAGANS